MRDLPFFTTENGVASLTLQQIPYWGKAYVRLQKAQDPLKLLEECVSFCCAAGANQVFAAAEEYHLPFPLHTQILRLSCHRDQLGDTDAALFPVMDANVEQWTQIYNERMRDVDNAAYFSAERSKQLLRDGCGYFIHRDNELLGIGSVSKDEITALVSVEKGAGADVLLALNHALWSDVVYLEVASTNLPAINLYRRLGFIQNQLVSQWYKVF